eukprot:613993-Rhodomonas_salina.2
MPVAESSARPVQLEDRRRRPADWQPRYPVTQVLVRAAWTQVIRLMLGPLQAPARNHERYPVTSESRPGPSEQVTGAGSCYG